MLKGSYYRKELIKVGAGLLISTGLIVGSLFLTKELIKLEKEPYKYENPERKSNIYNIIAGGGYFIGTLGFSTSLIGGALVMGDVLQGPINTNNTIVPISQSRHNKDLESKVKHHHHNNGDSEELLYGLCGSDDYLF